MGWVETQEVSGPISREAFRSAQIYYIVIVVVVVVVVAMYKLLGICLIFLLQNWGDDNSKIVNNKCKWTKITFEVEE